MKFKKTTAGIIAAAMAMSCLTLSAGAEGMTVDSATEAEAIVAAMQEGDIFYARLNEQPSDPDGNNYNGSLTEDGERVFGVYDESDVFPPTGKAYLCTVLSDGSLSIAFADAPALAFNSMDFTFPDVIFGRTVSEIVLNANGKSFDLRGCAVIPSTVTSIESGAITFWGSAENHVIYGVPGSCAETYANENGCTFMDISSKSADNQQQETAVTEEQTSATEAAQSETAQTVAVASSAGNTQTAASDSQKDNADTGAEGVAVFAAVAVIAAGAVVIGRKRK